MTIHPPKAMTIAGSDAGGGSGIQADLRTFAAFGVYGTSVVTAVIAQNSREVAAIAEVPEEIVIAQIDTIVEDIGADAVKTGALATKAVVEAVVDRLEAWGAPRLVVDPLIVSASGAPLLQPNAVSSLRRELLPRALIVTATVEQAELLTTRSITTMDQARDAVRALHALGPRHVVLKGGQRLSGDCASDGDDLVELDGLPLDATRLYGIDSTFSAAVTALLARGEEPLVAILQARRFVKEAARVSFPIGDGRASLHQLYAWQPDDLPATHR